MTNSKFMSHSQYSLLLLSAFHASRRWFSPVAVAAGSRPSPVVLQQKFISSPPRLSPVVPCSKTPSKSLFQPARTVYLALLLRSSLSSTGNTADLAPSSSSIFLAGPLLFPSAFFFLLCFSNIRVCELEFGDLGVRAFRIGGRAPLITTPQQRRRLFISYSVCNYCRTWSLYYSGKS
ncbi:hypothetical protein SOVF_126530 isoform C [Spinacia oleracea]|nr:hypothetical protein SOVF_126530 isoform C [Spinacia oleracea]